MIKLQDNSGRKYSFDINAIDAIVFTDVDGVLTDATVEYRPYSWGVRKFNVRDGHGFQMLKEQNIAVFMLSGENDMSIWSRANKLNVPFYHCRESKEIIGQAIIDKFPDIPIAVIGDDIMDIPLLRLANLRGCPADAMLPVKELYEMNVMPSKGGHGAFRDFANLVLHELTI